MNEIEYNGQTMQYKIIKSNIKNMYIHVKEGVVTVKAPRRLTDKYIIEFVNKKSKWIYEKVKESESEQKHNAKIDQKGIKRLEKIVEESVKEYSFLLGMYPNKVRIRDIKYAWGSCSSKRNITINRQLALKEENIIKYVVLHEICHLKYMNHSKQFWDLVEKIMPNYKIYKKQLKN